MRRTHHLLHSSLTISWQTLHPPQQQILLFSSQRYLQQEHHRQYHSSVRAFSRDHAEPTSHTPSTIQGSSVDPLLQSKKEKQQVLEKKTNLMADSVKENATSMNEELRKEHEFTPESLFNREMSKDIDESITDKLNRTRIIGNRDEGQDLTREAGDWAKEQAKMERKFGVSTTNPENLKGEEEEKSIPGRIKRGLKAAKRWTKTFLTGS